MTETASSLVLYESAGGVATLTLNRPEKRNALSPELIAALRDSLARAEADKTAKAILLRGAGKDFCAGMDLTALADSDPTDVMAYFESARTLTDLYLAMRRHPKPIIAAIHGRAIGGGAGIATASDLILSTESAQLRYPEVNLGFIAAIVMTMLRRIVGEKQTFEIVALGDPIPAAQALSLGIVNHVYPDTAFDQAVEDYVAAFVSKSATALSLTKDMLYHIDAMSFEAAIHAGLYGNALARLTPDAQQGFAQFAGKRK